MTSEALTASATMRPSIVLRWLLAVIVAALLVALPFAVRSFGLESFTGLATQVLIYGIAALSLNLILGYGGMVSFGHAAFFGVGAYTVGILYYHMADDSLFLGLVPGTDAMLITLPAAMIVAGLVAAIIGAFSLRTGGVQFIMITLAFAQMLFFLFVSLDTYGGDDGLIMRRRDVLPFLDTRDPTTFYYLCVAAAALWLLITSCIVRSRFGFVLNGMRQNEQRMGAMGYAPYPYKLVAFIIAGMGAGLAGALMANYLRFASPDMLHWTKSGELMMMVILGGAGTLFGPLLGAAALVILEAVLTAYTENWQLPLGIILLVIVLFSHGGLVALIRRFLPDKP
ncbi:branched-chain amino acid ABC transporter permease [Microbacteriaceae bacterium K1510]|nr:branched-chain amino acid ABC transporter permease [Microbacteriaceae bacterium K1510]